MPYILSPIIRQNLDGMWFEGRPYTTETIYSLDSTEENSPPVNYSSHTLKPHSLTHMETAAHTQKDGTRIDHYFQPDHMKHFFGKATVLKLKGNDFKESTIKPEIKVWEITKEQLKEALLQTTGSAQIPSKVIISLEDTPLNSLGLHDPNYVLILSQEAADYLVSSPNFHLYGTSWKSSDFNPGSKDRPIHNTLFKQALIMECLDLKNVPAGEYFLNAFPLPLEGASESPVCPVLFTKDEIWT